MSPADDEFETGQDDASTSSEPSPHLRLHSVDIFVRNQERSLAFYLDKLGFELAFDARLQSGQRWVAVSPPNGTALLTLIQPEPQSAEYKLIGRATRVIFVTEDVAATYRQWSERGVRFRHTPRLRRIQYRRDFGEQPIGVRPIAPGPIWGEVFTRFEDIDRNSFALVSLDEVSKAVETQRRAQAEKLEAERRIAQEFEIARQVQARLFPQISPPCNTLDYAGVCAPARHVGGDYYDFLALGPQRLGLVIGDVAGKGIAAALLMANLQAQLRSQCAIALDQPELLLRTVNQRFYENTTASAYATLFFAEYDDGTGRLRYANCGHLSGVLIRRDGSRPVTYLASTSTVLGLFSEWECSVEETHLCCGDVLALYTDGVTEAFNESEEEFGETRLLESLHRHRALPPAKMVQAMLGDVQQFGYGPQHDDITLIVAKCRDQ